MQFFSEVDTRFRARKALHWGMIAALVVAVWYSILIIAFALGSPQGSALITAMVGSFVTVIVAAWAAFSFKQQSRSIAPTVLIAILFIDLLYRVYLTISGTLSLSALQLVFLLLIGRGLLNGIRGARALKTLPPDDDELSEIFA